MRFAEQIIHIDMDAFFVECERLENPQLVGKPVVVGGAGARGVVASASYEARQFGVQSAQPMSRALRACPQLVVVPPRHELYRTISERVFSVLRATSPVVEALSIDEAFLDVSGLRAHYSSGAEVAQHVRGSIREQVGIPSSAGLAANKLIAKLASAAAKPDGLRVVVVDDQLEFLHALPVRRLWGVGEATYAALERYGVHTVGDLAKLPEKRLVADFGSVMGLSLSDLAWGRDDRPVESSAEAKSVSVETTYDVDLHDPASVRNEVLRHSTRVAARLRRSGLAGRTVTLKVRFSDFTTPTRSITLESPTDVARDIDRAAATLLDRIPRSGIGVRLLGVGVSGLGDASAPRQMAIDRPAKWDDLEDAVTEVRERFGEQSVGPASLSRSARPDRSE